MKYNRLTIISDPYIKQYGKYKHKFVKCNCDCNQKNIEVRLSYLKSNHTKSCGCLVKDKLIQNNTKHNLSKHPLYKIWSGIKQRCYNKKRKEYKWYGDRSITICNQWKDNPLQFYNDNIDKWKPGLTIDRKNNNGNYDPENIRWVTKKIQANNTTTNIIIIAFNEAKSIIEWIKDIRCVVHYHILYERIFRLKWNPEKAIITPVKQKKIK